jgi:hypothetical protein
VATGGGGAEAGGSLGLTASELAPGEGVAVGVAVGAAVAGASGLAVGDGVSSPAPKPPSTC